jgi:S-adenosyl methyltransferase
MSRYPPSILPQETRLVTDSSSDSGRPMPEIDPSVPNSARIWNYWLGGKDSYPVDWAAGSQFVEVFPGIVDAPAGRGSF